MKIRTQFIITMILFGAVLLFISASVIITDRQVRELNGQERLADNIEQGASDLSYLADEYLLYHESQQRSQWESEFASISADLARLQPNSPGQQALVDRIKANQQRLKAVFADVVATVESTSPQGTGLDLSFFQVSWSRMAVQDQGMVFDASRLSQMLGDQDDQLQHANTLRIIALIVSFGVYLLINYYIVYRRTFTAIADLQAGTEIIGAGNLDFAIPQKYDDEISDLTRAFNRMAANLARANEALSQQAQRLRLLHGIDQAIMAAQSPSEIAGAAVHSLVDATAAVGAIVALFDFPAGRAEVLAGHGVALDRLPPTFPLESYPLLAENRQAHIGMIEDVTSLPDGDALKAVMLAAGIRGYTAVPLVVAGEVIGAVVLGQAEPGPLGEDVLEFVRQAADQLAVAIQHARLYEEVQKGRQQLRSLSHHLVALQEAERKNLARELHDHSGQSLTALKLGLGLLKHEAGFSPTLQARVDELSQTADQAAVELHDLAVSLRPTALDRYGLVPALEQCIDAFRKRTSLEVEFLASGLDQERVAGDVETALYRIVQEALTNVARHAQASRAGVILSRSGTEVSLILEDDGCGFDPDEALRRGRLGLLGMRERAEMLGGALTIESQPGCGTTLYVNLPAPVEPAGNERSGKPALGSPDARPDAGPDQPPAPDRAPALPEAELARAKALSDALNDFHQAIAPVHEPAAILQIGLHAAAQAIGADLAVIAERCDGGWEVQQAWPAPTGLVGRQFSDEAAPLVSHAARTGQLLVVGDVLHDPRFGALVEGQFGSRAAAVMPLSADAGRIGWVISLTNQVRPRDFAPAEIDFLQRLTASLSMALENARLHQAEARQLVELQQKTEELEVQAQELQAQNDELLEASQKDETALAARARAQQALRRSEATYRAIARNFPNGAIYVFDPDLRYLVVEGELLPVLGQTPEKMEGKTIWEAFDERTAQSIEQRYRRALAGESLHFETFYGEPFGNRTLSADYRPIWDGSPRHDGALVVAGLLVIQDITERVRMEEALREATDRLEQRVHERTAELEILHEIDRAILAAQVPAEIAQAAVEKVQQAMRALRVTVVLCDFAAQTADILAAAGPEDQDYRAGARVPLASYPMIEQMKAGQIATIQDMLELPDSTPWKDLSLRAGFRSATLVPLVVREQMIGVLTISRAEPGALPSEDLNLAAQIADSLAISIHSARLLEQIQVSREQLQALSRRLVDIQERERRYVADQLFNEAGQVLAALKMHLARPAGRDPVAYLAETQELLDRVMQDLHHLATHLRPISLDRLGLVAALKQYAEEWGREQGLPVQFAAPDEGGCGIGADVETAIYRVTQEALTNVAQHAKASLVTITVRRAPDRLTVAVKDDGVGFDPALAAQQGALGLFSMRERAEAVGARLVVESQPGYGTTVSVEV